MQRSAPPLEKDRQYPTPDVGLDVPPQKVRQTIDNERTISQSNILPVVSSFLLHLPIWYLNVPGKDHSVAQLGGASIKGDPKWAQASKKWTGLAGPLVLTIVLLSIVQIVLGVLLLVSKNNNLAFGTVVQALIVPGLSFFNAIPSAHLHILARSNPPKLAIWFSSILAICYITSAAVYLAAGCFKNYNPDHPNTGLQKNDCPSGDSTATWDVNVALQLLSFICYAVHAAMAFTVSRFHKKRTQAIEGGTLVPEIDLAAKAKREDEARERWKKIVDL